MYTFQHLFKVKKQQVTQKIQRNKIKTVRNISRQTVKGERWREIHFMLLKRRAVGGF